MTRHALTILAALAATTATAHAQETCGPVTAGLDGTTYQACTTPLDPADVNCDRLPHQAIQPTGDRHITLTVCPDPLVAQLRAQLRTERARHHATVRRLTTTNRRLRAQLRHRWEPNVTEAITIAALVSGVPRARVDRVVHCESGHNPLAENPSPHSDAGGLVQYVSTTWRNTTFGRAGLDRFSPYANVIQGALAMRHSMSPWTESRHCWSGS